jgi:signal transduction histidine kinase
MTEEKGARSPSFTPDDLLHFSRVLTIGELSACFAHEVTNPLMLIRGNLRLIDESLPADHPLRVSFESIARASQRIEEMAKRMLDFSRSRSAQTEPCEIAELISEALRFIRPYIRARSIDVRTDLNALPMINLDRWQIIQALVNLLQNATDSMAGVERRVLSINSRIEGDVVRIAVSDTGSGIAPGDVQRIFEPFFTTKGESGTGLGLFITRLVVEAHGGSITVETSAGETTFVISLPR